MSTKKIREALTILAESYQEATNSKVVPGEVVAAMKEVEDIEKVAVEWVVEDAELSQGASDILIAISEEVLARRAS